MLGSFKNKKGSIFCHCFCWWGWQLIIAWFKDKHNYHRAKAIQSLSSIPCILIVLYTYRACYAFIRLFYNLCDWYTWNVYMYMIVQFTITYLF